MGKCRPTRGQENLFRGSWVLTGFGRLVYFMVSPSHGKWLVVFFDNLVVVLKWHLKCDHVDGFFRDGSGMRRTFPLRGGLESFQAAHRVRDLSGWS